MQTTLDLVPRYSLPLVAIMLATIVGSYLVVRLATGPAVSLARQWGLLAIRLTLILLLIALLSNPVSVAERPGALEPADVFLVLDASQSMALSDQGATRWDQAIDMIRRSLRDAGQSINANLNLFRFGRRLEAVADSRALGIALPDPVASKSPETSPDGPTTEAGPPSGNAPPAAGKLEPVKPDEPDTQLLVALRQMTSRFGRRPPAAVVVFSDGRARDAETADEVAGHFARLGVPIHVAPLGDAAKGGDVSVVSLVAPATIRKHSLVNVHAFVRSYGYSGHRAELELWSVDTSGNTQQKLDSAPLTLADGFQSVNLSFQSDENTRNLRALVQPRSDEVSPENNRFDTDVRVDRTKIRVLYVEGSPMRITAVQRAGRLVARGPHSYLQEALEEDPDIECTVLSIAGSRINALVNAFPATSAELAAYDAIILSGVPSSAFSEEQLAWIDDWIGKRGAGLCMVGGALSFTGGGWERSPLEKILPVQLGQQAGAEGGERIGVQPNLSEPLHPIFRLLDDQRRNRDLLQAFPAFRSVHTELKSRPNVATVLATAGAGNFPAITAGRYGRGRTLAMAFPIVAPAAEEFVNWGVGGFGASARSSGSQYYNRFCRNVVYWLTENSFIGRRRLAATTDKRFYEPGETVVLAASAYDEAANPTSAYRLVAMIEPQELDVESDYALVRWPSGIERTSGADGPLVMWGEEFEIPLQPSDAGPSSYGLTLQLADAEAIGESSGGMRLELTAYEGSTQLDSMSLPLQVVYDPFEQQNPFPNHELLKQLATKSGGHAISTPTQLAEVLRNVPVTTGPSEVRKTPAWSNWWLLGGLLGVLSIEWCWRRRIGLA
ncbi:MAG: glutamine amidotransferase [Pirellulales bacterium]